MLLTDGHGPNSAQRTQINEVIRRRGRVPAAVVTGSPIARGIMTALRWFNPALRPFAPGELARALEYVGIPAHQQARAKRMLIDMRIRLAAGDPGALRRMAAMVEQLEATHFAAPGNDPGRLT